MLEHIKLFKHKGLNSLNLNNLGKINVICGKNNSGKSTILQAINSNGNRGIGIKLNPNYINNLYLKTYRTMGWHPEKTQINQEYKNQLSNNLKNEEILYQSDINLIHNKVINQMQKNYPGVSINGNDLKNELSQLYNINLKPILLSPKRKLDLKIGVNSIESPNNSGGGILNSLFKMFNSPEGSENNLLYKKINDSFNRISSGYEFQISLIGNNKTSNQITLNFRNKFDNKWRTAENAGNGLQDLLVILYFSITTQFNTILIEEPENHIHPEMQRKLLYYLKSETDKQFFIATHSSVFLDLALVDKVLFSYYDGEVKINDATSRARILSNLGYSVTDNLVSDLIILVEGPSDKPVIEEYLMKMGVWGLYDIKLWPLGGDNMSRVDLSVFSENYSVMALIDSDPKSNKGRIPFTENCTKLGINLTKLNRYSIENYFSPRVINDFYKQELENEIDVINPDIKLEDQLGIGKKLKQQNGKLAKMMTLEEIKKAEDLYDFLVQIRTFLESAKPEK